MKILYIADGRSPTAMNWIRYFAERDYQVHLITNYYCAPEIKLASLHHVPFAFSGVGSGTNTRTVNHERFRSLLPVGLRTRLKHWTIPLALNKTAKRIAEINTSVQPDLVHAMRIPFEGMLAVNAGLQVPLLISVWGNDFTLHAPANAWMKRLTKRTLQQTDALHTDCYRDIGLAEIWGFPVDKPRIVLPGAGGIRMDIFYPPVRSEEEDSTDTVINPRGIRAYVNNQAFFHAAALVLKKRPAARFLCPAMDNEAQAQRWVERYNVSANVVLLPRQSKERMASLFRQAKVAVSPSTHDGTPNSLLEAMASGCLPIAGDIESLREWITPGVNGLLVNPNDPQEIADAILLGLEQDSLRRRAMVHNQQLIAERADYRTVMPEAADFYRLVVDIGMKS
ncbi:MAG: glycosyltransferase family 4 protein [Chloroflexota bacterium]|nr:glycosyltransferase family 4 protein [Chloroflexota bacterium]